MSICKHHRQKLDGLRLLPCANPDCKEGKGSADELTIGQRVFRKQQVVDVSKRRGASRRVYFWREEA